jgi:hypothetical protein
MIGVFWKRESSPILWLQCRLLTRQRFFCLHIHSLWLRVTSSPRGLTKNKSQVCPGWAFTNVFFQRLERQGNPQYSCAWASSILHSLRIYNHFEMVIYTVRRIPSIQLMQALWARGFCSFAREVRRRWDTGGMIVGIYCYFSSPTQGLCRGACSRSRRRPLMWSTLIGSLLQVDVNAEISERK